MGILVIIYLILGYWATGETICKNKVYIEYKVGALFMHRLMYGAILGLILIPVAIIKKLIENGVPISKIFTGIVTIIVILIVISKIFGEDSVKDGIEDGGKKVTYNQNNSNNEGLRETIQHNKTESKTESLLSNIEGTYIQAGGDYYGASGDEAIKIEKNGNGKINIYWIEFIDDGSKIIGYEVIAMAEEVPIDEFSKNTYVVLLGVSNIDCYYINFMENNKINVEGEMWAFIKKDINLDLTIAVDSFKTIYPYMDYVYSSYVKNVDIIYWENLLGIVQPISFNRKWYEQFNVFEGVGTIEIIKRDDNNVDILLEGNVYCSFNDKAYVMGDSYSYVTYKCEDGTEFEFYPAYEDYRAYEAQPMIRLDGLKENLITEEMKLYNNNMNYYIEYGADYMYVGEIGDPVLFDKEWYKSYNHFENNLNYLQINEFENELVLNINGTDCCRCKVTDYVWDEDNKCIYYTSYSMEGFIYYPEANIIMVKTGEYTGEFRYINYVLETTDKEEIVSNEETTSNEEIMSSEETTDNEEIIDDEETTSNEENAGNEGSMLQTEDNKDINNIDQNYMWYLDYDLFANENESVRIEVYSYDDDSFVMIWGDVDWNNKVKHDLQILIGIIPNEIGSDGEYIYRGGDGYIAYYPSENYIIVEINDEEYDGKYHYFL